MRLIVVATCAVLSFAGTALAADDILDAIDQARKSYQSADFAGAKQSLDLASQLIGQKNAEAYGAILPKPLAGWTADEIQTQTIGSVAIGASTASRNYTNAKGDRVQVQITGDSMIVAQFAPLLANPQIAGVMGKIIQVGNQRAIQTNDGEIHMVVANKFYVSVSARRPLMPRWPTRTRSTSPSCPRCKPVLAHKSLM